MKKFGKILSVLLALTLMLSVAVPAFAAESNSEECPVIIIPGIATSRIYTDKDDPATEIPTPDAEIILELVKETVVPALVVFSADRNAERLALTITDAINTTFADWFNNPDGSAKGNAGARLVYPSKSAIKAGAHIVFDYDWRGNPVEIASQLDDFINYVTETGGYDKVAIAAHSLGNVVALSYLSLCGDDKVQGIVFDSPAIDGVTYVGDLFCGEMEVSAESIGLFLKDILGETEYEELMTSLLDVFTLAGIPEMLSVFLNDILDQIMPTVYKETLIPLCGSWLTVWSLCPDNRIDEAMDSVFNNYCKDQDLSALREKIDFFNSNVRPDKHQKLLDFDEEGRVAVISRYGYSSLAITPSYDMVSDSVIETTTTSFGAYTAVVGECFSDAYLENKDLSYISPDRTVDASTCLFPEKTWFIKNLRHHSMVPTSKYYNSLLFSEQEATVDNYKLSRFSYYDTQTGIIAEDVTTPDPEVELSPLEILFNFLKALFEKFIALFR